MWGKRVKLFGTLDTEVGCTGHHHHEKSVLVLTWFRAYDAETGRWLSADPLGEEGGINLYGYVGNNPIVRIDSLGLDYCQMYTRFGHSVMKVDRGKKGSFWVEFVPRSISGWPFNAEGYWAKWDDPKPWYQFPTNPPIRLTPAESKKIEDFVDKKVEKQPDKYGLLPPNMHCGDAVTDALKSAVPSNFELFLRTYGKDPN
jgi:RHS repeat-associated protein